jgi:hypothetical protein
VCRSLRVAGTTRAAGRRRTSAVQCRDIALAAASRCGWRACNPTSYIHPGCEWRPACLPAPCCCACRRRLLPAAAPLAGSTTPAVCRHLPVNNAGDFHALFFSCF